jgi:hypothetical protein
MKVVDIGKINKGLFARFIVFLPGEVTVSVF